MGGELENLSRLFRSSGLADKEVLEAIGNDTLQHAIGEFLIQCPVYRYYGNKLPLQKQERKAIQEIFDRVRKAKPELTPAIDLVEDAIINKPKEKDGSYNAKALHFYQRCMQFTGPLMAKGVEDTLMYTYNRFIAHNDVGDSPEAFGISVDKFHKMMLDRQQYWPASMNTTSTHDTKRGEDARARLNVLTDIANTWLKKVKEWQKLNKSLKKNNLPDANDEYFIYQTLVAVYPMHGGCDDELVERIQQYIQKALREAKVHSDWSQPDEAYENATTEFIKQLFSHKLGFIQSFAAFHRELIDHGIINSLSQLLLKFTCPGIPDVYQGTELWDFSLVDPDNRRPVDYTSRMQLLDLLDQEQDNLLQDLWKDRLDGNIKLWLTQQLFLLRRQNPDLFTKGKYIPLQVKGKYKENIIAFARCYQKDWYVIVAPLHTAGLCEKQKCNIKEIDWANTRILLPSESVTKWKDVLRNANEDHKDEIFVKGLFKDIPVAILKSELKESNRDAGILMAISSLPSAYGVGDIGPEAKAFADFLYRSCQSYWQLLPLNPTEKGNAYSPYSSISSMAGNTLLLSPDLLVAADLVNREEVEALQLSVKEKAEYEKAEALKDKLFDIAYANYKAGDYRSLNTQFQSFCEKEAYWLNDYALYVALKRKFDSSPWFQWPEGYKDRDMAALQQFSSEHADEIKKVKWLQLLFSLQWSELRDYCNSLGVKLFGDLPFYVSYDSADVWSNRKLFCLDKDGGLTGIAGVPPDYFSEDGQLWGMPTFNWHKLKEDNYSWWIQRLKKNLELFDIVRLDHFRAFAEYWQVPAGEETARNGKWLPGPGIDFFDAVKKELGGLPFIAEDLGDNMDPVYELRDKIGLPGMKVLQFAFGEHMPDSVDIPHNYTRNCIVYTGTHDNNTTHGWYHQEANRADHKRLEQYVGSEVRIKNVHLAMGRMAYASVAKTAILPMQDVIGLDAQYRMNTPGSAEGNWLWRLKPGQLDPRIEKLLRSWTKFYNRY